MTSDVSTEMRPDACPQATVAMRQAAAARGLQLDVTFTESAVRRMLASFGEVFCPETERAPCSIPVLLHGLSPNCACARDTVFAELARRYVQRSFLGARRIGAA